MKKIGMELKTNNEAIQGPRGLSIKEVKFKQTLSNGDNVYQVILEDNSIIGELTSKKGDKGDKGEVGNDGRGIVSVVYDKTQDNARYYKITYTDNTTSDFFVENGDSAYEIAVTNGFEGTEEEWLESLIGKGLEFNWNGTQLGVRVEGEEEYQYVDLKGDRGKNLEFNWNGTQLGVRQEGQNDYQYQNLQGSKGNDGKNLEFTWRGTELGVRVQGQSEYQYVDLKGEQGDAGTIDMSNYYNKSETDNKLNTKISKEILGNITNEEQLNNATTTGIYKVVDYKINGLYGYGLLYVSYASAVISQYYVSHQGGTCYRQDWNGNIANGKWITQYDNKNLSVYTKSEIDTKFKNLNLIPCPVGGILLMYNNSNPAELYPNTTWEKITSKYLRASDGTTPLKTGGANSVKISKANLPAEKLQIESFNVSAGTFKIVGQISNMQTTAGGNPSSSGAFYVVNGHSNGYAGGSERIITLGFDSTRSGASSGNLGSASPYTKNMGSGTALNIEPAYITLHVWKRLS